LTNNVKVVEFKDIVSEFKLYNFSSFSLIHPGESSGYSLNDQDKKFCYLLDNEFNKTQKNNLIKFCENSDFIIWDGMFTENELKTKKGWGHSSIEQGLKFAEDLDLKKLIISHHAPDRTDEQIDKISAKYKNSNLIFAQENKEISFYGKT
jgi:ribonuclease BN (tRNA processing enzyme)